MRKWMALILTFIILILQPISTAQPVSLNELTMEELINRAMVTHYLPGLVIGVVQDGEVLYQLATGNSRVNPALEMDLNLSLVQTGSVSKVFTSYVLLQLMKENGIDPGDEIEPYIIGNMHPYQGITFGDVLSHTTGVSSVRADSAYRESPLVSEKKSFSQEAQSFFDAYELSPVIETGQYILPSNVNNIMAGMLIESISGHSYESVMAETLLRDFSMRTTASVLEGNYPNSVHLAQNYAVYAGRREPLDEFRTKFLPSDDFITTGHDMVLFMEKITGSLGPYMQDALFSRKVGIDTGRSYGLSTVQFGNVETYLQDGGVPGATARLMFIPQSGIGIFFAYNSGDLTGRDELTRLLLDELLPSFDNRTGYSVQEGLSLEKFTGVYSPVNASKETIEKLTKIIHQVRVVSDQKAISIDKVRYVPVGDTLFYSETSNQLAEFKVDSQGKLLALIVGNNVYEKASFFESLFLEVALMGFLGLFNVLAWLVFVKKWHDMKLNRIHDTPRAILIIHTIINSMLLIFIYRASTTYAFWDVIYGDSPGLLVIKILGILAWLFLLPTFLMIRRLKSDFRWQAFMTFVFGAQGLLTGMVGVWLLLYNFI